MRPTIKILFLFLITFHYSSQKSMEENLLSILDFYDKNILKTRPFTLFYLNTALEKSFSPYPQIIYDIHQHKETNFSSGFEQDLIQTRFKIPAFNTFIHIIDLINVNEPLLQSLIFKPRNKIWSKRKDKYIFIVSSEKSSIFSPTFTKQFNKIQHKIILNEENSVSILMSNKENKLMEMDIESMKKILILER